MACVAMRRVARPVGPAKRERRPLKAVGRGKRDRPIDARNAQRAAAAAEKRQANDLRRQDLQLTANLTRPSEYMDGGKDQTRRNAIEDPPQDEAVARLTWTRASS